MWGELMHPGEEVYFLRDKVKPTPGPLLLGNCLGVATVSQTTIVTLRYKAVQLSSGKAGMSLTSLPERNIKNGQRSGNGITHTRTHIPAFHAEGISWLGQEEEHLVPLRVERVSNNFGPLRLQLLHI